MLWKVLLDSVKSLAENSCHWCINVVALAFHSKVHQQLLWEAIAGRESSDCILLLILLIAAPAGCPPFYMWDLGRLSVQPGVTIFIIMFKREGRWEEKKKKALDSVPAVWPSSGKDAECAGGLLWSAGVGCSVERLCSLLQAHWKAWREQIIAHVAHDLLCGSQPSLTWEGGGYDQDCTDCWQKQRFCWTDTSTSLPQTWRA